ncbi:MAG: hypothetical protein IIB30_06960 [Chloroflexi bacterium]|nr:hypothetical protein [Chloroflexota bacterium]
MTEGKQSLLEDAQAIHGELLQLVEGMGYCLDWKPDPAQWSARQVIYHLLETPPGGIAPLLRSIFSGSIQEFDLWAGQDNVTPERLALELEKVESDIGRYFQDLQETITAAGEEDFTGRTVMAHWKTYGRDQERTAKELLEGLFARHWREHMVQLGELREALGL